MDAALTAVWVPALSYHRDMARILAIADEKDGSLSVARIRAIAPDVIVSCGDLPFEYLEFIVSVANKPLLFVPGNHDPELPVRRREVVARGMALGGPHSGPIPGLVAPADWADPVGPQGCTPLDGRIEKAAGVTFAGLGGSIRYRPGPPHMYTEREMRRRARRLGRRAWLRRGSVDVFVAHSPPAGLGDMPDDAHRGFEAFHPLLQRLQPALMLHGHIHPHGFAKPDRTMAGVRIVNVIPSKVIEL